MKKIIIFRTDRLGDFLIISRIIYELKKKFPLYNITVVCSEKNLKMIRKLSFIDEVIVFNKYDNFFNEIKSFIKIISKKYYLSLVLDGKKISLLCNIFIKSKKKYALIYRKKIGFWPSKFYFTRPGILYRRFFLDKYLYFTSRKSLTKIEHLPTIFLNLVKDLNLNVTSKKNYIFESNYKANFLYTNLKKKLNLKNYILIHLDEKWLDIKDINFNLFSNITFLQKIIRKKIVITSFNNSHQYFLNIKKKFSSVNLINNKFNNSLISKNSKIYVLENTDIFLFERLINYADFNVSCHSGFLVQVCGANKSKVIDIINKNDFIWYSCWKPFNTFHKFIFKTNSKNEKKNLKSIFISLSKVIKS